MSQDYIDITPTRETVQETGLPVGMRVRVISGPDKDRRGTVVGWGRGTAANEQFQANVARADAEQRLLTSADYEPLVDGEGPVVAFDDEDEKHWYPGQAMSMLWRAALA